MQVVPLDCLIHYTSMPIHVSRTTVQILVPIIMMAILMLAYIKPYHAFKGRKADPSWLRRHIKITAFSVAGFFYPSLSQAALNIFSCYPIDVAVPDDLKYKHLLQVAQISLLIISPHTFPRTHLLSVLWLQVCCHPASAWPQHYILCFRFA